ncbi:hypothetical protein QBC34DRAFT_167044 [Podospora aff. communis PSN243]|uniref:Secreted protein n=1 Tax=Podospora aff. communis PSN243 TaxID=3040156 RepID=A0AAV9GAB0_9PEZI|nr:hypothetical protein QBC34DRAFT_167044 [Podospora aff. communis PSN243]
MGIRGCVFYTFLRLFEASWPLVSCHGIGEGSDFERGLGRILYTTTGTTCIEDLGRERGQDYGLVHRVLLALENAFAPALELRWTCYCCPTSTFGRGS